MEQSKKMDDGKERSAMILKPLEGKLNKMESELCRSTEEAENLKADNVKIVEERNQTFRQLVEIQAKCPSGGITIAAVHKETIQRRDFLINYVLEEVQPPKFEVVESPEPEDESTMMPFDEVVAEIEKVWQTNEQIKSELKKLLQESKEDAQSNILKELDEEIKLITKYLTEIRIKEMHLECGIWNFDRYNPAAENDDDFNDELTLSVLEAKINAI